MEDYHYQKKDILKALNSVGVKEGDVLFSHIGTGFLGYPKEGKSEEVASRIITEALLESIGSKGTLIVPTYTYSFCNNLDYDPNTSPSTVGYFTERFRKLPGVKRSIEPIFSVAAIGPLTEKLFKNLPMESFGPDCIYDRLTKIGASICNIGVGFRYATYIHFVEKSIGVPYRYDKTFSGNIIKNNKKHFTEITYYVRTAVDDRDSWPDLSRLEEDVRLAGVLHEAPLGRSSVTRISCKDLYNYGKGAINKDKWYLALGFLKHKTKP